MLHLSKEVDLQALPPADSTKDQLLKDGLNYSPAARRRIIAITVPLAAVDETTNLTRPMLNLGAAGDMRISTRPTETGPAVKTRLLPQEAIEGMIAEAATETASATMIVTVEEPMLPRKKHIRKQHRESREVLVAEQ
jgi:hypothetical protein